MKANKCLQYDKDTILKANHNGRKMVVLDIEMFTI